MQTAIWRGKKDAAIATVVSAVSGVAGLKEVAGLSAETIGSSVVIAVIVSNAVTAETVLLALLSGEAGSSAVAIVLSAAKAEIVGRKVPPGPVEAGMTRLFLSIGRKDHVMPRDIVGAIAGESNISGKDIGAIDIYDKFTFVDVAERDARVVIRAMDGNTIKGKQVQVDIAK